MNTPATAPIATPASQWIEVLRTGTFTAMSGEPVTITDADLAALEATQGVWDGRRAPLVLGHPKTDDPAWGWVAGLKRTGNVLLARFDQVADAVRELVRAGRYKHVSVKLTPDKRALVHVGLLGAAAPAVGGLRPVSLAAVETQAGLELALAAAQHPTQSSQEDNTMADDSQGQEQELKRQLAEAQARIKELEAQLQAASDGKAKAEQAFAAHQAAALASGRERRFAALVAASKTLPAEKTAVLAFAEQLGKSDQTIQLSGPDGTPQQVGLEESYWLELEAREPRSLCTEFALGSQAHPNGQLDLSGLGDRV